MTEDFTALCTALWKSLGLGQPRAFGPTAVLTIDERVITLSRSTDDRHVIVSADCGRVSTDPVRQTAQLRQVMRDGLGLVVSNPAVVHVVPGADGVVAIQALCPCRADGVVRLTKAIEDVLQALDIHGPTLNDDAHKNETRPGESPFSSDESLIFRL